MFMKLPDTQYLKECFTYDPDSGRIEWLHRPAHHYASERIWKTMNTRYAGKEAFTMRDHCGYRKGKIAGVEYHSHRVIWKLMTGEDPTSEIDHINGVRDDNRWSNLRCVTHGENMKNTRKRVDNRTGVTGVNVRNGKFCARVQSNGFRKHLGYFDTLAEAEAVIIAARQQLGLHDNHGLPGVV